jgi:hypothetical protein
MNEDEREKCEARLRHPVWGVAVAIQALGAAVAAAGLHSRGWGIAAVALALSSLALAVRAARRP